MTDRITGDALEASEFAKIQGVGSEVARQVAASMEATDSSLEILKGNLTLRDPDGSPQERIQVMNQMVTAFERFSDITIYSPDGFMTDERTTLDNHPEKPMKISPWFELARDTGEIVTSTPHRVLGVPGLHIKVYIPVRIRGWDKPHVLVARVSFESVANRIEGASLEIPASWTCLILGATSSSSQTSRKSSRSSMPIDRRVHGRRITAQTTPIHWAMNSSIGRARYKKSRHA